MWSWMHCFTSLSVSSLLCKYRPVKRITETYSKLKSLSGQKSVGIGQHQTGRSTHRQELAGGFGRQKAEAKQEKYVNVYSWHVCLIWKNKVGFHCLFLGFDFSALRRFRLQSPIYCWLGVGISPVSGPLCLINLTDHYQHLRGWLEGLKKSLFLHASDDHG